MAGFLTGSFGPAPTSSGPSAGGAGSVVSVDARREAFVSRRVVRLAVVAVVEQEARRATASKLAAILVIIFLWNSVVLRRESPDGLYNYYILAPIGKKDFCETRRIFANPGFP